MKILFLCRLLPSSREALSQRSFYAIKYLKEKYGHEITIVSLNYIKNIPEEDYDYLKCYCKKIIEMDRPVTLRGKILLYTLDYIRRFIAVDFRNIFDFTISSAMKDKVLSLTNKESFDLVYVDDPTMVPYAIDLKLPKIVDFYIRKLVYKEYIYSEKGMKNKLIAILYYLISEGHEKSFKNFNLCITPTLEDKTTITRYLPGINVEVVPWGIKEFDQKESIKEDFPTMAFLGSLNSIINQKSVLYLYNEIYPQVKKQIPALKFYIIGRSPPKEIKELASDSVIVTGFVENVSDYILRSTVITLPVHGYGIKTRVLECMAMGKPIITNSDGVHGIEATSGKEIVIADNSKELIEKTIELLKNKKLRDAIGSNAKALMCEKYTWEIATDYLNNQFIKVIKKW